MPFVVTLEDITPPRRADAPWTQALLSEAGSASGPWTLRQTINFNTLPGGIDADPRNPQSRDLTTTEATAESGLYYSVVFKDGAGNASQRSTAVFNNPEGSSVNWRPTVDEVGNMLRMRTIDSNGNEVGTFTSDTRPTYEQADEAIDQAVQDLYPIFKAIVPDAPINATNSSPEAYREAVSALAATRAALIIERTHFGKEVASGNSPYKLMWDDYRQQLLQVASMLGLIVPGLTPTEGEGGVGIIGGTKIADWGNEVGNAYTNLMTRPY